MKLCDFDSARLVGEPLSRDGKSCLKFSSSWVSPEVFLAATAGGNVSPSASLWIDLFSLGLLIEVLCRQSCDPSSTALPSVSEDSSHNQLQFLLSNQESLYKRMESLDGDQKSQTEVVRQLLSLNPSSRGDICQILGKYETVLGGTTGLRRQKMQDATIIELKELIVRLNGQEKLSRDDLEGALGDQMTTISNLLNMKASEIVDRLCGGVEESRLEMFEMLKNVLRQQT